MADETMTDEQILERVEHKSFAATRRARTFRCST